MMTPSRSRPCLTPNTSAVNQQFLNLKTPAHSQPCLTLRTPPMKMLCNMEVRETAGIQIDNTYVFACTQKSQSHITGWHALNNVCDEAGIKEKTTLTATKNRHRVSTLYAALDLPDAEQALFFKHMGHSANINQNIYQVPLAIREVTQVGMQLQRIDKGPGKPRQQPSSQDSSQSSDTNENRPKVARNWTGLGNPRQEPSSQDGSHSSDGSSNNPSDTSENRQVARTLTGQRKRSIQDGNHSSDGSSNNPSDSNENRPKVAKNQTGRRYTRWTKTEADLVFHHFSDIIKGKSSRSIPGSREVEHFLNIHGLQLDWMSVRNKVMNEKVKWNSRVKKRLDTLQSGI